MTHPGGRPRGTTSRSDCSLLWAFLRRKNMGFGKAVKESKLARGTVSSCLKRFTRMGFITKTMKGKRPIYQLIDPDLASKHILVPAVQKRAMHLAKLLPRLDKAVQIVKRNVSRLGYEDRRVPAVLKKFEEWAWSKVPEGMSYEEYWGHHPPSIMSLAYALKKHPPLEERIFQSHRVDLEEMLKELKKIEEFEQIIRREKAAIRKSARIGGIKRTESTNM